MRLPAIECVRRGLYNARANWELILAQWLGLTLTLVLSLASVLPFFAVIGFAGFTTFRSAEQASDWVEQWLSRAGQEIFTLSLPMVLSIVAALAVGTLAMLVYCFFQAGLFGVLVAGDRQAPAGAPGDWRLFRTWSAEHFRGWGAHRVWRFFWFFNVVLVAFTVLLCGFVLLAGLAAAGATAWGGVAAVGIGCGGLLPLLFLAFVMSLWVWVAQADLASEDSGVRLASRRALRVVARRLPGLLLILVLGVVASVVLSMVFLPVSMVISLVFRDSFVAGLVLRSLLTLVQWGVSGGVQVALAGATVALVRSELREGLA